MKWRTNSSSVKRLRGNSPTCDIHRSSYINALCLDCQQVFFYYDLIVPVSYLYAYLYCFFLSHSFIPTNLHCAAYPLFPSAPSERRVGEREGKRGARSWNRDEIHSREYWIKPYREIDFAFSIFSLSLLSSLSVPSLSLSSSSLPPPSLSCLLCLSISVSVSLYLPPSLPLSLLLIWDVRFCLSKLVEGKKSPRLSLSRTTTSQLSLRFYEERGSWKINKEISWRMSCLSS